MTWSITAKDPATGGFGVAVTTKFFGVGAICPFAAAGIGAISTQAFVNPTFGPRGLRLLAEGLSAEQVLHCLIESDEGREHRQLHLIDSQGRVAARTGDECIDWNGHRLGEGFSVAGNMLAGEAVVTDTFDSFAAGLNQPLAERFLDALDAGQAAGGDYRGKQSAAMLIYTTEDYPCLSLRVDDHSEPLVELRRLYEESQKEFRPFMDIMPSRARPAGVYDPQAVNAVLERQRNLAESR